MISQYRCFGVFSAWGKQLESRNVGAARTKARLRSLNGNIKEETQQTISGLLMDLTWIGGCAALFAFVLELNVTVLQFLQRTMRRSTTRVVEFMW